MPFTLREAVYLGSCSDRGTVSRLGHVSTRTLRYYDEEGLLVRRMRSGSTGRTLKAQRQDPLVVANMLVVAAIE